MKDRINELKEAFCNARNDKDREFINVEMQKLINDDPDKFAEAMTESAKETADRAAMLSIRQKMEGIIPAISLVYIAKEYFGKTDAWLYQRINGNVVNGKPARFTDKEIDTLKHALNDISKKIGSTGVSL
jgi:hypothetical protein